MGTIFQVIITILLSLIVVLNALYLVSLKAVKKEVTEIKAELKKDIEKLSNEFAEFTKNREKESQRLTALLTEHNMLTGNKLHGHTFPSVE